VRLLAEIVTHLPTMFAMRAWRLRPEGPPEQVIESLVGIILAALKVEQQS
jgi:hypothetical protein